MTLTRNPFWDTRDFQNFLMMRAREPFVWGKTDCALLVADGIEAMTGVDIAADFRGRYTNEAEAAAVIEEITGGKTVADAAAWCAAKFELYEWPTPLCAQRGDMVTLFDEGRLITGLVHLNGRDIVAQGEAGLKRIPITAVERSWHV